MKRKIITKFQTIINSIELKITSITEDNENYSKASLVKKLHNQIYEKDNLISIRD
jgi:hypothetical protein